MSLSAQFLLIHGKSQPPQWGFARNLCVICSRFSSSGACTLLQSVVGKHVRRRHRSTPYCRRMQGASRIRCRSGSDSLSRAANPWHLSCKGNLFAVNANKASCAVCAHLSERCSSKNHQTATISLLIFLKPFFAHNYAQRTTVSA